MKMLQSVHTYLIVQQGYRGGDVSQNASVQGFTKLKLENPLTFFFHPLDNLSIVYFLRRHETDLPGNLGNKH